ncbi:FkbM family methyltransferase [Streptomyces sp. NPDC045714]|uniref:FkbM family methyltransferase n=1 Tax=Streptomyces sp. NPDC045714 TaxID=3154913 RepID=UPI0033C0F5C2
MTRADQERGVRPLEVLGRESARCVAAIFLAARRGRGVSRATAAYWMARRFLGVLGTPVDDNRLVSFRFDGPVTVRVRRNQSDLMVLWEVLLHCSYDLVAEYGVRMPERLDTIVDLGANTGLASAYLCARYRPRVLLAVEPVPDNVAVLRGNARLSGTDWRIEEAAVGSRAGSAELFVSGLWDSCTTHPEVARARRTDPDRLEPLMPRPAVSARMLSMPDLFDRHGLATIDLLKVDIEGGESDLFAEPEPWMNRVDRIVAEIHDKYIDGDAVRVTLHRAGFDRIEPRRTGPVRGTPNRVELFLRR